MKQAAPHRRYVLLLPAAILAGLLVLSLFTGKYPLDYAAVPDASSLDHKIFWQLRVGRSLAAAFSGAALSLAGHVFQIVLRSPLAAPDVAGVASGAGCGAAGAILLFGFSPNLTALGAFLGALAAVSLVLFLSGLIGRGQLVTLLLSGIAVNAVFQALLLLLKIAADTEGTLSSVEFWLMGSFSSASLSRLLPVLPWLLTGAGGIFLLSRPLFLLSLPDDEAALLGISVRRVRALALIFASLMTGAVISLTGLISFVGLIAPHIGKRLLPEGTRRSLLLSAFVGAGLTLAADILARSLHSAELPVSVITSLIGAPLLFLLLSERRYRNA